MALAPKKASSFAVAQTLQAGDFLPFIRTATGAEYLLDLNTLTLRTEVYLKGATYSKSEVDAKFTDLTGAAPPTLDTIYELAAFIQTESSAQSLLVDAVGAKMSKAANGGDIADPAAFRGNLQLGTASLKAEGYFALASHTHSYASLTSKPTTRDAAGFTDIPTVQEVLAAIDAASGGEGITDPEVVRDTIAAAIVQGTGLIVTVNDGNDTITIAPDPEFIRDTIAATFVNGAGITVTTDDAGNTTTITSTGGSGGGSDVLKRRRFFADFTTEFTAITAGATGNLEACFRAITQGVASSVAVALPSAAGVTSGDAFGFVSLQTGTETSGFAKVSTHALGWRAGVRAAEWNARLITPNALSNSTDRYLLRVGLIEAGMDGKYTTSTRGIYFRYADNDNGGKWIAGCANSSAQNEVDTGVAVTLSTMYAFRVTINAAGTEVKYYINGTLVATITSNIPTAFDITRFGCMMLKELGTTNRTAWLDYLEFTPDADYWNR